MSDAAPPRLEIANAGLQPGYAPISWTAVASLGIAIFFVVVLGVAALYATLMKESLLENWLFAFPILSVVLAFVARKQIEASEGTRTGLTYATAGWWISIVVGLGYAAYLLAVQFTIRNDAEQTFTLWTQKLKALSPDDPNSNDLYEACYLTIPPAVRAQVSNPRDKALMNQVFGSDLTRFKQLDVIRIAMRNPGKIEFVPQGMRDWQEEPRKLSCTLSYKMITPEGEYGLLADMQAAVEEGTRTWQVVPTSGGMVKTRNLSQYGWLVQHLEETAQEDVRDFLQLSAAGAQANWTAYEGYVRPDGDLIRTLAHLAIVGAPPVVSKSVGEYDRLLTSDDFFTAPGGSAMSSDERVRLRSAYLGGRITQTVSGFGNAPEVYPVLSFAHDAIEVRVPIQTRSASGTIYGSIILRCTDPDILSQYRELQANPGPLTATPPRDITSLPVNWKVTRIESDLKTVVEAPSGPPG